MFLLGLCQFVINLIFVYSALNVRLNLEPTRLYAAFAICLLPLTTVVVQRKVKFIGTLKWHGLA
jgi:hypothetical protein